MLVELVAVGLADFLHRTHHALLALLDPHAALAEALDLVDAVADEQDGDVAGIDEALNAALALLLEEDVANGQRLINNENIRFRDGSDGERDARNHTA